MDNFKLYTIRCITNMHVGNGDAAYSIIDNQVQRDAITNFPVINSSSLKGSLREFLKNTIDNNKEEVLNYIFGHETVGVGKYKIFPGMLLSIPVRSDKKPFFRATCPRIIKDFKSFIDDFKLKLEIGLEEIIQQIDNNSNSSLAFNYIEDSNEIRIEGFEFQLKKIEENDNKIKKENIENIFGQDLLILDDETFSKIISELPVIARNKLENGESQNLWYEEMVPRESKFYFGVIQGKGNQNEFEKIVKESVQIGGNATIGYGYCDINCISKVGDQK